MIGFGKVELLVVIALVLTILIIGTLGSLNVQKQLRDSKRKADIGIIAGSLELHYNSKSNQFCKNSQIGSYCHPKYPWFEGGVPIDPLTGDYLNLPNDGDKQFLICAKLEGGGGNYLNSAGTPASSNNGSYYCQSNQQ